MFRSSLLNSSGALAALLLAVGAAVAAAIFAFTNISQEEPVLQPTQVLIIPTATLIPATDTATPTITPTQQPPTQTPVPLKPYLSGGFTTCDNVAGYVNFKIAEDAPTYDPATFKVLFNGQEANCKLAGNNSTILTCNYPPAPNAPPALIQVFVGDQSVNEFKFAGGAICDPAPQHPSGSGGGDEPAAAPTATQPPGTSS